MTILCIGDSNTYGYDPRSFPGSRYPADVRWTERLPGVTVLNGGVNGMRIPGADAVDLAVIRQKKPDLITVMLGTNDLLEGASAREAGTDFLHAAYGFGQGPAGTPAIRDIRELPEACAKWAGEQKAQKA